MCQHHMWKHYFTVFSFRRTIINSCFLPPLFWLVWSHKNNVTKTCAAPINCTGSCLGEKGLMGIKCCVVTLVLLSKLLHNAEAYCDLDSCVHREIVDVNPCQPTLRCHTLPLVISTGIKVEFLVS